MNAVLVRELQTYLSCHANIDKIKVEYHHKMPDQEKLAGTVLAKDKATAHKKLNKYAASSEVIVVDASQKMFQLKNGVLFQKEEIYRERLTGDEDVSQERVIVNKTLLSDRKFQSYQLTKLKQRQYSTHSTNSCIISESLEQVEKLNIASKESKDAVSKSKREFK